VFDVPVEIIPVTPFQVGSAQERMDLEREIAGQVLMADLEVQGEIEVRICKGRSRGRIDIDLEFDLQCRATISSELQIQLPADSVRGCMGQ
jgi:hypothetical protein